MIRLHAALLFLPLVAACSSTGEPEQNFELEALPLLGSLDLAYEGSLSSRGLPRSAMTLAVGREGEMVAVHCEIFATSRESVAALFGDEGVYLRAVRVELEAVEELRDAFHSRGLGRRIQRSQMRLGRGGGGNLVVSDQVAYVGAFELRSLGTSSIGDPSVAYAQDGFMLELHSADGEVGTPCELEIDLHFVDLMSPLSETTAKLPGAAQQVTIQTPVFTSQHVHVEATFQEDTAVVVGPIPGSEGEEPLMVLLRLELEPVKGEELEAGVQ